MKGFVFDLDNTLFDRYGTLTKIMIDNFERIRPYINPAYDAKLAAEHICFSDALYNCLGSWNDIYAHLVGSHFFNAKNIPGQKEAFAFMREQFKKVAVEIPYTRELVSDIRAAGYKTGIITNGTGDVQKSKLALLNFSDLFDEIIVSGDFAKEMGDELDRTYYKPNRAIFDEMAKRLSADNSELYYVGDSPTMDMQGAVNAGYVPVWIAVRSPWCSNTLPMPKLWYRSLEGIRELI